MAAMSMHSQPVYGLGLLPAADSKANSSGQRQPLQPPPLPQKSFEPFDVTARRLCLRDFESVRTIGTGTFARVQLVRLSHGTITDRSKVYALKILRKTKVIKLRQIDHVCQERQILDDVKGHPFLTDFIASFSDHDFLYILLDYVPGGELFTYLREYRRFNESTARFYAAEIVLILEYLHETQGGIAYRDMKPENLLLDADGHIKLVDFGFAKRLGNDESGHPVKTYTLCGTPEYLAPEVIREGGYTTAVDWWALGILIYEFLTGYTPFWHEDSIEIYKQIVEKTVAFPQEPAISEAAKDIISQLCTDRSRRLGVVSGGAANVKAHRFFAGTDWDAVYRKRYQGPIIPPIRYLGDAQCFSTYPEEDIDEEDCADNMVKNYDHYFEGF
ncbi:camp-dependent protein kinase catalytic subunit [Corynascus novoguineensis]|uniref:cAMP-dependent protein kinase n=1 Tax=Corynascus novoguineensis TaxID=1126955 RepID=A0AAN7HFP0_9PEZI|nr:camp-dependent protein kinase catalytic subunit [Corynascus novoguineensis]